MKKIDILLDTNIVIYLLKQEEKYIRHLETLVGQHVGISVITYMEVLVGIQTKAQRRQWLEFVHHLEIVSLSPDIAERSADVLQKRQKSSLRDPKLADTIIAQTALVLDIPLVTNNAKDFARFKNLELIVP